MTIKHLPWLHVSAQRESLGLLITHLCCFGNTGGTVAPCSGGSLKKKESGAEAIFGSSLSHMAVA